MPWQHYLIAETTGPLLEIAPVCRGVLWFDCCVDAGLGALRANFMFYSKYVIIIISDYQAESTEKGK